MLYGNMVYSSVKVTSSRKIHKALLLLLQTLSGPGLQKSGCESFITYYLWPLPYWDSLDAISSIFLNNLKLTYVKHGLWRHGAKRVHWSVFFFSLKIKKKIYHEIIMIRYSCFINRNWKSKSICDPCSGVDTCRDTRNNK